MKLLSYLGTIGLVTLIPSFITNYEVDILGIKKEYFALALIVTVIILLFVVTNANKGLSKLNVPNRILKIIENGLQILTIGLYLFICWAFYLIYNRVTGLYNEVIVTKILTIRRYLQDWEKTEFVENLLKKSNVDSESIKGMKESLMANMDSYKNKAEILRDLKTYITEQSNRITGLELTSNNGFEKMHKAFWNTLGQNVNTIMIGAAAIGILLVGFAIYKNWDSLLLYFGGENFTIGQLLSDGFENSAGVLRGGLLHKQVTEWYLSMIPRKDEIVKEILGLIDRNERITDAIIDQISQLNAEIAIQAATVARGNGALLSITAQLDKLALMIEKYQEIS